MDMTAIDSRLSYLFSLSSGLAWEIFPCEGSDEETRRWVERFVSYMGLEPGTASSARRLCFGKMTAGNGHPPRFNPGLPADVPAAGWRAQGNSGMMLLRHPEVLDIYCGLYPDDKPAAAQMRRPLVPVFEEVIRAGGLPLHGALVERRGAGLMFVGRSGAGKSTCCRRLPYGWRVLGDDLAIVVRDAEGGYTAHPLPTWSAFETGGNGWPCRANDSVPLRAFFFLHHEPEDGVEALAGAKTALVIEDAGKEALLPFDFFSPRHVSFLGGRLFANAVSLVAAVPAFRLRVSLEGRFWEQIDDVLEGLARG
ncbi:MAG: SynChlorMet cassette protein ScmC [Syntrophales bacterium]|nr:SynChlorMet cassette protein ScmC [Syntrophales bacterium]